MTRTGNTRLLAYLRVVEILLDHGQDTPAVAAAALRALERFGDVARDPRFVPSEHAQHALVDASEQLLAQLRGPGDMQ